MATSSEYVTRKLELCAVSTSYFSNLYKDLGALKRIWIVLNICYKSLHVALLKISKSKE
jgi:hypothetical protein